MQTTFNGTWEQWTQLSAREKDAQRDNRGLHPRLKGLEGKRVEVSPKREYGASRFWVGITTGWMPVHLAMHGNAHGSSDVVNATEQFDSVKVLKESR